MLGGLAIASVLAWAAPPHPPAQPSTVEAEGPEFSLALDSVFSLMFGDFGTSSTFRFGVRPRPHLEFSAQVGVAHQQFNQPVGPAIAETRTSNVMLGARWIQDDAWRRSHAYVGLSLVVPTDVDGRATQFQNLLAKDVMRMRGGWDFWLWLPSTAAVVVPFGWSHHGERGVFGVDGALAGLAHPRGDAGVGAQLRLHGGLAIRRSVVGLYGTSAYNGLNSTFAFGGGPFVATPLCKSGRERCPVHFTATASVTATHEAGEDGIGLQGPSFNTGVGLRWGATQAKQHD